MNKPLGYNPMRWDCKAQGKCYNLTLRPRIEEFAGCFPGRISMSDVDGIVEVGGHFLLIEWKSAGGAVTGGQRIMFEKLTALSRKVTVVVVCGDPRLPTVETVQVFRRGIGRLPERIDLDGLKRRIEAWSKRAAMHRIAHRRAAA